MVERYRAEAMAVADGRPLLFHSWQDFWGLRRNTGSATHDFEILVAAYRRRKIRIADADGMLAERRDTVVHPFTGPLVHLFPRLDAWAVEQRESLRAEIKTLVGL